MRKTALAVAVGGLFIAPAAQAQIVFGNETLGTVQFYGKLYPEFGYGSSTGATQPGTTVSNLVTGTASTTLGGGPVANPQARRDVDAQNSYLGFRGERNLIGGLKAIWQVEQSVELDSGGTAGTGGTGSTAGTFSNRNSFLGLRHGTFGTVKLGRMDSIYKEYGDTFQMFGISSGNFVSASNVLSNIGVNSGSAVNRAARFHERFSNSLQYEAAQFAGFTAGVQYVPDEARGEAKASPFATAPAGTDQHVWSYGVKWDSRLFYASVHQEQHFDFFGGSSAAAAGLANNATTGAHSRDIATRFSGEWRFMPDARITLDVSNLRYREYGQAAGIRFERYQHNTWAVGWDQGFGGPLRFAVQYVRGNEGSCSLTGGVACSTTGLYGYMLNGGVRYRFDRQTFVFLIASKLWNGPSARYDNWSAGDPARGGEIVQTAIGLSYVF
ncbi:MAG: porin [Betaproteobacteria bacterium]|nr:MAG: porin [Betaproteobacteria bacterium]